MGNQQSRPQPQLQPRYQYQQQQQPSKQFDGPYFGGYGPGDFSIRRKKASAGPDFDKALPDVPQVKTVHFGTANTPAWEFYRGTPTWDNTANTRYASAPTYAQANAQTSTRTQTQSQVQSQSPNQVRNQDRNQGFTAAAPPAYVYDLKGELQVRNR